MKEDEKNEINLLEEDYYKPIKPQELEDKQDYLERSQAKDMVTINFTLLKKVRLETIDNFDLGIEDTNEKMNILFHTGIPVLLSFKKDD